MNGLFKHKKGIKGNYLWDYHKRFFLWNSISCFPDLGETSVWNYECRPQDQAAEILLRAKDKEERCHIFSTHSVSLLANWNIKNKARISMTRKKNPTTVRKWMFCIGKRYSNQVFNNISQLKIHSTLVDSTSVTNARGSSAYSTPSPNYNLALIMPNHFQFIPTKGFFQIWQMLAIFQFPYFEISKI